MSKRKELSINEIAVQRRFRLLKIPRPQQCHECPDRFLLLDSHSWRPPNLFETEEDARLQITVTGDSGTI